MPQWNIHGTAQVLGLGLMFRCIAICFVVAVVVVSSLGGGEGAWRQQWGMLAYESRPDGKEEQWICRSRVAPLIHTLFYFNIKSPPGENLPLCMWLISSGCGRLCASSKAMKSHWSSLLCYLQSSFIWEHRHWSPAPDWAKWHWQVPRVCVQWSFPECCGGKGQHRERMNLQGDAEHQQDLAAGAQVPWP